MSKNSEPKLLCGHMVTIFNDCGESATFACTRDAGHKGYHQYVAGVFHEYDFSNEGNPVVHQYEVNLIWSPTAKMKKKRPS